MQMAGIPSTTHALTEPGVLIYDRKYGLALDTAALINANYQNHKLNPASPENAFGRSRPYFRTSSRRGRKRKHPTATPAPSHKIRSYMYYDEPFIEEALRRLRELWQRTGRRVSLPDTHRPNYRRRLTRLHGWWRGYARCLWNRMDRL